MFIERLEVSNFRNYINQKVFFSRETNVFYGNNGQGKTNLLEAVSLFSSGKSFRRAADRDLIRHGEDYARVFIEFDVSGVKKDAEIFITNNRIKLIKLCGVNLKRTSELLGVFKCVVFSPEELMIINGAPELRRNFADMVLCSLRPLYYDKLKNYYKILKQKNNLLKRDPESIKDTLSVWNEALALEGTDIMVYRAKFIDEINSEIKETYSEISGGREELRLKYVPSVNFDAPDKNEINEKLLKAMNRKMQAEICSGVSMIGIHRDDFEFYINEKNAKSFASTGQQRSAVVALKEAQARLIYKRTDEEPVLLLDDVLSELDCQRRDFIMKRIKNRQVIITCTDKFTADKDAKYFYVENGTVREE
jgi:DNA replication and repair protein RecF